MNRGQLSLLQNETAQNETAPGGWVGLSAIEEVKDGPKYPAKNLTVPSCTDLSLIGQRFGKLVVHSYHSSMQHNGKSRSHWLCQCDCGSTAIVSRAKLRKGEKKSCGCLAAELTKKRHEVNRRPRKLSASQQMFNRYKHAAKARTLPFNLSFEQFSSITEKDCFYCGIGPTRRKFKFGHADLTFPLNGVDRVDSSQGYYPDNCVPCCMTCNRAKSNMPILDFINWLTRITHHMEIKHA